MKKHNTSFSVLEHKESSQVIDLINIYVPPIYGAIVVFYTLTCYIHEKLCIFVYNCLNWHGCTWIYIYLLKMWIFNVFLLNRFFAPVFFRFRFSGWAGSSTGPVLITLLIYIVYIWPLHVFLVKKRGNCCKSTSDVAMSVVLCEIYFTLWRLTIDHLWKLPWRRVARVRWIRVSLQLNVCYNILH